jgi:hypothetical protein
VVGKNIYYEVRCKTTPDVRPSSYSTCGGSTHQENAETFAVKCREDYAAGRYPESLINAEFYVVAVTTIRIEKLL